MVKLIERDNWSCFKFEVFFKMGIQYTIVLKLSDCILLYQAQRNWCQRFQAYRGQEEDHSTSEFFPLLLPVFWPPVCYPLRFYSERSMRNSAEDGAIAARLLPLTSFHCFCGSLLFISICNMFTSKMIMLGRDITSLTFHSSVQFS